ncbi:MAG: WYL domain-containing protein [Planctomycetes bacterium]|nr:WYL domain-containing protein [Planctomycetota bacterium]
MSVYRAHFGRLLELDEQIRAGKYPNCTSFARHWEVSTKTVQRDVEFLRDSRGAPLAYDRDRRGYYYTDPSWQLKRLDLTEGELFELAVAQRMASQYRGTPIAASLQALFGKVRAALPSPVNIDPVDVQTGFSFHGHPTRDVDEATWHTIARALRDRRILTISYRGYGAAKAVARRLVPIHLTCLDGEWALVAHTESRAPDATQHAHPALFALSRMTSASVTQDPAPTIEFDPDTFFANRFGRFIGKPGRVYDVEIRFDATVAPGVLERRWHPKQTVRRERGGSIVISFPAPAIYEAKRWVLQWGAAAEVLAPAELRDAVAKSARLMRGVYAKRRASEE